MASQKDEADKMDELTHSFSSFCTIKDPHGLGEDRGNGLYSPPAEQGPVKTAPKPTSSVNGKEVEEHTSTTSKHSDEKPENLHGRAKVHESCKRDNMTGTVSKTVPVSDRRRPKHQRNLQEQTTGDETHSRRIKHEGNFKEGHPIKKKILFDFLGHSGFVTTEKVLSLDIQEWDLLSNDVAMMMHVSSLLNTFESYIVSSGSNYETLYLNIMSSTKATVKERIESICSKFNAFAALLHSHIFHIKPESFEVVRENLTQTVFTSLPARFHPVDSDCSVRVVTFESERANILPELERALKDHLVNGRESSQESTENPSMNDKSEQENSQMKTTENVASGHYHHEKNSQDSATNAASQDPVHQSQESAEKQSMSNIADQRSQLERKNAASADVSSGHYHHDKKSQDSATFLSSRDPVHHFQESAEKHSLSNISEQRNERERRKTASIDVTSGQYHHDEKSHDSARTLASRDPVHHFQESAEKHSLSNISGQRNERERRKTVSTDVTSGQYHHDEKSHDSARTLASPDPVHQSNGEAEKQGTTETKMDTLGDRPSDDTDTVMIIMKPKDYKVFNQDYADQIKSQFGMQKYEIVSLTGNWVGILGSGHEDNVDELVKTSELFRNKSRYISMHVHLNLNSFFPHKMRFKVSRIEREHIEISKQLQENMFEKLFEENLACEILFRERMLNVWTWKDASHVLKAKEIFEGVTKLTKVDLGNMTSETQKEFQSVLENKFDYLVLCRIDDNILHISYAADNGDIILKNIRHLEKELKHVEQTVELSEDEVEFFLNYHFADLEAAEKHGLASVRPVRTDLENNDCTNGFRISGSQDEVVVMNTVIRRSVTQKPFAVEESNLRFLETEDAQKFLKDLQQEHKCIIRVLNSEDAGYEESSFGDQSLIYVHTEDNGKKKISVVCGPCDIWSDLVLVLPVEETCQVGNIRSLLTKHGLTLRSSSEIRKRLDEAKPGGVTFFPARQENLDIWVSLIVVCKWNGGGKQEKKKIHDAMSVLVREHVGHEELQDKTILIPWTDFKYLNEKMLKAMVHSLVASFKEQTQLKIMVMADRDDASTCKQYFHNALGTRPTEKKHPRICLRFGELAKTEADVLVNTTSPDLNLENGAVSKSLLDAAGYKIQQQCNRQCPEKWKPGELVQTTAGRLPKCKAIFHGSLPQLDRESKNLKMIVKWLKTFMINCLQTASHQGFKTIAFPALGTGNLEYPADLVVSLMYHCVETAKLNLDTVTFVIYPGNKKMCQVLYCTFVFSQYFLKVHSSIVQSKGVDTGLPMDVEEMKTYIMYRSGHPMDMILSKHDIFIYAPATMTRFWMKVGGLKMPGTSAERVLVQVSQGRLEECEIETHLTWCIVDIKNTMCTQLGYQKHSFTTAHSHGSGELHFCSFDNKDGSLSDAVKRILKMSPEKSAVQILVPGNEPKRVLQYLQEHIENKKRPEELMVISLVLMDADLYHKTVSSVKIDPRHIEVPRFKFSTNDEFDHSKGRVGAVRITAQTNDSLELVFHRVMKFINKKYEEQKSRIQAERRSGQSIATVLPGGPGRARQVVQEQQTNKEQPDGTIREQAWGTGETNDEQRDGTIREQAWGTGETNDEQRDGTIREQAWGTGETNDEQPDGTIREQAWDTGETNDEQPDGTLRRRARGTGQTNDEQPDGTLRRQARGTGQTNDEQPDGTLRQQGRGSGRVSPSPTLTQPESVISKDFKTSAQTKGDSKDGYVCEESNWGYVCEESNWKALSKILEESKIDGVVFPDPRPPEQRCVLIMSQEVVGYFMKRADVATKPLSEPMCKKTSYETEDLSDLVKEDFKKMTGITVENQRKIEGMYIQIMAAVKYFEGKNEGENQLPPVQTNTPKTPAAYSSTITLSTVMYHALQHFMGEQKLAKSCKMSKKSKEEVVLLVNDPGVEKEIKEKNNSLNQHSVEISPDYDKDSLERCLNEIKSRLQKVFVRKDPDKAKVDIAAEDWAELDEAKKKVQVTCGIVKATTRSRRQLSMKTGSEAPRALTQRQVSNTVDENEDGFRFGSLRVCVYNADLTTLNTDAIVNAANGRLLHGAGVARAIASKAGRRLLHEGNSYVANNGPIPVTGVVKTTAGNLPSKMVLHAVGPDNREIRNVTKCFDLLTQTILRCLIEAENNAATSVAIPAISSGIFMVPTSTCCMAYVRGTRIFSSCEKMTHHVKEVHFVDINTSMLEEIRKAFQMSEKEPLTVTNEEESFVKKYLDGNREGRRNVGQPSGPDENISYVYRCRNVPVLRLCQGSILNLNVDSVVSWENTMGQSVLNSPKELLPKTQRQGSKFLDISTTDGKQAGFEHIFHAVVPVDSMTSEDVTTLLKRILRLASDRKQVVGMTVLTSPKVSAEQFARLLCDILKKCQYFVRVYVTDDQERVMKMKSVFDRKLGLPEQATDVDYKKATTRRTTERKDSSQKCAICQDTVTNAKTLKCGHMFCRGCIDQWSEHKPVCPSCYTAFGLLTGTCPDGIMTVCKENDRHLPGYEGCRIITIYYTVYGGIQTEKHPNPGSPYRGLMRTAYLPDNDEGRKVLALLRVAWDRKLTFTVGRSTTMGQDNRVTWNDIHHKTNVDGGPANFGYPDPDYLRRVQQELASHGVTERDLDTPV